MRSEERGGGRGRAARLMSILSVQTERIPV